MKIDTSRWDWIAHEVYRRLLGHAVKYGVPQPESFATERAEAGFRARCQAKLDAWVSEGGPVPPAEVLVGAVDAFAAEELVKQEERAACTPAES